jgi:hypothetical protein
MKKKKNPWFIERSGHKGGWSFVPMNGKGWVALIVLVLVNVFAANYFKLNELAIDGWSSFGVVFFLSILVFILIARRKTGVKK